MDCRKRSGRSNGVRRIIADVRAMCIAVIPTALARDGAGDRTVARAQSRVPLPERPSDLRQPKGLRATEGKGGTRVKMIDGGEPNAARVGQTV